MAVYTTIDNPADYFNIVIWSGDDTSSRNITGVGFQPDLVWGKVRSRIGNHWLIDSIRGTTGSLYRVINADDTAVEQATNNDGTTAYGIVTTIGSDGFTVADGNQGDLNSNNSGDTYIAWCWKAGTSFSNDASATSIGTVDSTGSASATSGFSIVSFDLSGESGNETIKHGLSTAPKVVITKRRSGGAGDWTSYFGAIGNTYLVLNKTSAGATTADFMNNTAPTTSVFTVGDPSWWATDPFIAYCFSEVQGFSKFSSFTGNNSTDGAFVYLGFRPAWVMIKSSGTGGSNYDWVIFDNKRNTFNVSDNTLDANLSNAEVTSGRNEVDFLSNGFKCRSSYADVNSNTTYIYMAFAEAPFVNSNGVPCNAR